MGKVPKACVGLFWLFKDFVIVFFFFRIILDCDSSSIVSKVAIRTDDIPIGEQTVSQVG